MLGLELHESLMHIDLHQANVLAGTRGRLADATGRQVQLDHGALTAPQHEAAGLLLGQIAETALPDAAQAAHHAAAFAALTRTETAALSPDA
jgi:predicted unusual protein kinase regulating ubiquinone biosynthesis (AarF/ABC1/UbiB family)